MTRPRLAELSGLPERTVAGAATRLISRGLVQQRLVGNPAEAPKGQQRRRGRPPLALELSSGPGSIGVIVISHSAVKAAMLTTHGEVLSAVIRKPFRWWSCPDLGSALEDLLRDLGSGDHLPALDQAVLGIPMPYQPGRGITFLETDQPSPHLPTSRYPSWVRGDLASHLSRRSGVRVLVENDVNLAALGEATAGVAAAAAGSIYLKLGAELAAGIVIDGRILRGTHGAAGELGHLHIDPNGPICHCGARGCLGTTATAEHLLNALRPRYGQQLTILEALSLAAQGEPGVRRVLTDLGRAVGAAIANTVVLLDLDAIVLDAALGPAVAPVIDGLRDAVTRAAPTRLGQGLAITLGQLADAELFGAAAVSRPSRDPV